MIWYLYRCERTGLIYYKTERDDGVMCSLHVGCALKYLGQTGALTL